MDEAPLLYSAYIGNLSIGTSEEQLREAFSAYDVTTVVIHPQDPPSQYTYGFVRFLSKEDRDRAVRTVNGHIVEGRRIRVEPASKLEQPLFDAGWQQEVLGVSHHKVAWTLAAGKAAAQRGLERQRQKEQEWRLKLVVDAFSRHNVKATECMELLKRTPYGVLDFDEPPPKPSESRIDLDFYRSQLERMREQERLSRAAAPAASAPAQQPNGPVAATLTVTAQLDQQRPSEPTTSAYQSISSSAGEPQKQQTLPQSAESLGEAGCSGAVTESHGGRFWMPETCHPEAWNQLPGESLLTLPLARGRGRLMAEASVTSLFCGRGSRPVSLD